MTSPAAAIPAAFSKKAAKPAKGETPEEGEDPEEGRPEQGQNALRKRVWSKLAYARKNAPKRVKDRWNVICNSGNM